MRTNLTLQLNCNSSIPPTKRFVVRLHVSASKAASGLSADSTNNAPINENSQTVVSLGGLPQHISDSAVNDKRLCFGWLAVNLIFMSLN